jgi:excisionase family DNA binding protein
MGYLLVPRAEALRAALKPAAQGTQRLTLSVSETAKCIGVSKTKIYDLFDQNKLPWIKIGARRVVRLEAIKKYLEANEVTGAA